MAFPRTLSFWRQRKLLDIAANARLPSIYSCTKYGFSANRSVFTLVARPTAASEKRLSGERSMLAIPRAAYVPCTVRTAPLRPYSTEGRSTDDEASSSDAEDSSSSSSSDSEGETSASSSDEDVSPDDGQRTAILEASLQCVPELGWGAATLAEGAKLAGFPGSEGDMLPRGVGELIDHFDQECNRKLVEFMKQQLEEDKLKAHKLIRSSVEQRLRMIIPYFDKWPQAMALKALPPNAPTALENLALLVDDMWYYGGDRSTDFNWYTKRALLATIYTSTELYMVQDSSADFEETWQFLDNRMKDTQSFGHNLKQLQGVLLGGVEMVTAGIAMVRNKEGFTDCGEEG